MIGDALTTRLKLSLDFRLQFLSAHLDGVHTNNLFDLMGRVTVTAALYCECAMKK